MRALLSLSIASVLGLSGCWAVPQTIGETTPACEGNQAPVIDNLELNSWVDEGTGVWVFCLHFDWNDANANLAGGYVSAEVQHYSTPSEAIEAGDVPPDATAGELDVHYCPEGAQEGDDIRFEMRVRDACGAVSNEKSGLYQLGGATPHVQENPDVGGNGCMQAAAACFAEEGA